MSRKPSAKADRKKRFIDEYMIDCNASRAARAVGYSEKHGPRNIHRVLAAPGVKAQIEARQAQQAERLGITADRIRDELALIAFARMSDYVHPGPNGVPMLDTAAVQGEQSAALAEMDAGIEAGEDAPALKKVKVRLADKRAALMSLAKLLGFLRSDTQAPTTPAITRIEYNIVRPEHKRG